MEPLFRGAGPRRVPQNPVPAQGAGAADTEMPWGQNCRPRRDQKEHVDVGLCVDTIPGKTLSLVSLGSREGNGRPLPALPSHGQSGFFSVFKESW